ncbi:hypothetical protein DPV78_000160 [Talaromyces pinophilus]|nr:hypothetical protein DPV78_000160 [Talaromyces pinophilus]
MSKQVNGIRESIDRVSSITQRHDSIISTLLAENSNSVNTELNCVLDSAAAALLQINGHDLSSCSSDEPKSTPPICTAFDQNGTPKTISLPASTGDQSHSTAPYPTFTEICDFTFLVQKFFDKICPLFPIICDLAAMRTVSDVISRGCKDDIETCLILLLVAIGKESDNCNDSLGKDDFQCALSILTRVQCDFSLQFVQAEILAGIYLYRKFQIMESWRHIHAGYCFDELPKTPLSDLQDILTLPLGCEESTTTHMPMTTRTIYTFFLAETSLKAILARIRQMNQRKEEDGPHRGSQYHALDTKNPVSKELKCQLSAWLSGIPAFLNWSTKPGQGTQTKNASRLKLLFWFAKVALHLHPVKNALARRDGRFTMSGWILLQDTLLATYNMVEVFVLEDLDPDPILWNYVQFAITLLEEATTMDILQSTYFPELETVVQDAKELISVTKSSEQ